MAFPTTPTNGQTYASGGKIYTYNSTKGVWAVTSNVPFLIADLNAVSAAVNVVSTAISNEISVRTAASATLETHINTVSAAVAVASALATTADTHADTVSVATAAELSNRVSADTALSARIDLVSNQVSVISSDLVSAKANLLSNINAVSAAVDVVSTAISNEISVRAAASATLETHANAVSAAVVVASALATTADNHANTVSVAVGLKADIASPTFTGTVTAATVTLSGELRGPASFTIDPAAVGDNTGVVIIKGDLQVDGTTTTVNSTTMSVADKNIVLASGAANAAAASGAGLTVNGPATPATFTYVDTDDSWNLNKKLLVTGTLSASSGYNGTVGATTPAAATVTTLTASADSSFTSTGALLIPASTTANRPAGTTGKIRYNTTLNTFEGYGASSWGSIGGGAAGAGGDTVFQENQLIVTTSYTLSTGKSAMSVGPITINSGATVTIPSGHRWVVI
jgi:hypothetical protein